MRFVGLGLAALLAAGALAPAIVFSADKGAAVDKKALERGMAEAPALIAAAGLACTPLEARLIGESKDPKTKATAAYYEVACKEGMGYALATPATPEAKPLVTTCVDTAAPGDDGKPNGLMCRLPGNANLSAQMSNLISSSGVACIPEKSRGIGASPTNSFFEVACQGGNGYIIQASSPAQVGKPVVLTSCIAYEPGSTLACTLSDRAAILASTVTKLAAASGKSCAVKDSRYVLTTTSGASYFEVACADGKGYMLEQTLAGAIGKTVDCAQADYVGGGCRLTDARSAQTEQAGFYSGLVSKAGFACKVEKYALFGAPSGQEVVELKCSDRPDGAVAVFTKTGTRIYDCAHAELAGYRCSFSKMETSYASLTKDLNKLGKSTCQVSNARYVGTTGDGRGFNEAACADGLPGYMIEYGPRPDITPKTTIACGSASGIAGGCKLPGNTKK